MDLEVMRNRFQQMSRQQQLGNLASTLGRIANRARSAQSDELVINSLREAAYLIEWCTPNVSHEIAFELAAMQRELLIWRRLWPVAEMRRLLALHTRNQANRLLQLAGYVKWPPEIGR